MSIDSTRNNISRIEKEIARLEKQLSDEVKKESDKNKKLIQIEKSINKNTSLSSLRSKQNQMVTAQNDISKIVKKKADISKKIADKNSQKTRYQNQLDREVKSERNRQELADKRRQHDELRHQQQITEELRKQKELSQATIDSDKSSDSKEHDFFISHASEDKDSFVRPLAEKLIDLGLNVWYDEFNLKIGDSLRRSIDNGLKSSKFGIVVLSSSFFAKNWTQYELDGLVTKEMYGVKVILPIWHKVSKDEVVSYSPTLADKVALNTSIMSIDDIANELKMLIV
jgi:hypothetical protein